VSPPSGVAAFRGHGFREEQGAGGRLGHENLVHVPVEFLVAEPADRLAVLLDVGDQQHLAPPRKAGLAQMDFDIAEPQGEGDELVLVEMLAVEHQNLVLEPGRLDRLGRRVIEAAEVDAAHLAAKARRQTMNLHSHDDPPRALGRRN
jgi:hypothetical protein